jgi:hypothetical protein
VQTAIIADLTKQRDDQAAAIAAKDRRIKELEELPDRLQQPQEATEGQAARLEAVWPGHGRSVLQWGAVRVWEELCHMGGGAGARYALPPDVVRCIQYQTAATSETTTLNTTPEATPEATPETMPEHVLWSGKCWLPWAGDATSVSHPLPPHTVRMLMLLQLIMCLDVDEAKPFKKMLKAGTRLKLKETVTSESVQGGGGVPPVGSLVWSCRDPESKDPDLFPRGSETRAALVESHEGGGAAFKHCYVDDGSRDEYPYGNDDEGCGDYFKSTTKVPIPTAAYAGTFFFCNVPSYLYDALMERTAMAMDRHGERMRLLYHVTLSMPGGVDLATIPSFSKQHRQECNGFKFPPQLCTPERFVDFADTLIYAAGLVNVEFVRRCEEAFTKAGDDEIGFKAVPVKTKGRMAGKVHTDHAKEEDPKASCNIDIVRGADVKKTPLELKADFEKLGKLMDLVRVKNGLTVRVSFRVSAHAFR